MSAWITYQSNQLIQFSFNAISFDAIANRIGLPTDAFRLLCNGRDVVDDAALDRLVKQSNQQQLILFQIKLRLLGGKGGFGALLRSKKATVKTTNFGACRDLNGRRLRHVDQERALQEWQATAAQREQEKKRSALEAADNAASSTTAATGRFTDTEFASETIQYCDSVAEAVRSKRKKGKNDDDEEEEEDEVDDVDDDEKKSSSLKSTSNQTHVAKKSKKLFDDDEFGDSSDDDGDELPQNVSTKKNESSHSQ